MNPLNLLKQPAHPRAAFSLVVDDNDISKDIASRLSSLTLTDNRGFEADQLDIVLDDSDGKLDLPARGAIIKLQLGWAGQGLIDKGSYTVDELEHTGTPDTLTIRARSADLRGGLTTQRERAWHTTTVGEIVKTIAAENELEVLISAQLENQVVDHLDQTNESAVNLLTRLAAMFDAVATVKNNKLLFIHAGGGITASGKPLPSVQISRQDGDKHHFSLADRNAYTLIKATFNDLGKAVKGEVFYGKAEDLADKLKKPSIAPASTQAADLLKDLGHTYASRSKALRACHKAWKAMQKIPAQRAQYNGVKASYKDVNLKVSGEVSYGSSEVSKAHQNAAKLAKKDTQKSVPAIPTIDHSADNIKTLRHVYASHENAYKAAKTEWRKLQRGMATFSLTLALGRPELYPEMPTTVSGFKTAIDSTQWLIIKATHTLNEQGLGTALEFEIKATEIPG